MNTYNSYGAHRARVGRKTITPRCEAAQSKRKSVTIPPEEISFYTDLAIHILKDVAAIHLVSLPHGDGAKLQKEYERDAAEIRHRVRCEGLSFLTKTLPSYAKAVDTALADDTETVDVKGFELNPVTGLPRFLGGLLGLIFNAKAIKRENLFDATDVRKMCWQNHLKWNGSSIFCETDRVSRVFHVGGVVHPTENWTNQYTLSDFGRAVWISGHNDRGEVTLSVRHPVARTPYDTAYALKLLRQLCYSFYKLETPLDEKVQAKVLADFQAVDSALPRSYDSGTPTTDHVIRVARGLISRVLANSDPRDIICRHGPGAVATGEKPHQKPHFSRFYTRLNQYYPYDKYFFYNLSHLSDRLQELQSLEEHEAGTAKVVLVPKDSRGPRLISCEPLEYQWIQQGQMKLLVDTIQRHPLTRGRVNFLNQGVNRSWSKLASTPSSWNEIVTLDMKEASDRVSLALVKALFPTNWYEALYASRSSGTKLPDGTVVQLRKFAPMGSAVCFPVEALIFWAIGVAVAATNVGLTDYDRLARLIRRDSSLPSDPESSIAHVWVYGDDIICQRKIVPLYRAVLGELGLLLNSSKCCVQGFFRESCGFDAYFGIDVTPTKFRRRWSSRYTPDSHISWVAYSNAMYWADYHSTAEYIERWVQSRRRTPYVNKGMAKYTDACEANSPGYVAFDRPYGPQRLQELNRAFKTRFNDEFMRLEILADAVESQKVTGTTDGWEEMLYMSSFQSAAKADPEIDNLSDPNILYVRAGVYSVRRRVKLKRRWMPLA